MDILKERIRKDGKIYEGNVLKVDSFLNHQIDVDFMSEIGKEFHRRFQNEKITKILTIEASGIAIACMAAQYFHVPVVFAKKSHTLNLAANVYTAEVYSYTHRNLNNIMVAKDYIQKGDRILILDDFLARGCALKGLIQLCRDAGAEVVGCGAVIEKAYQEGHDLIASMGVRVESLARVVSMDPEKGVTFIDD